MSYFIWNGVYSTRYGILKHPPVPQSAPMNFEYTSITGRSTPIATSLSTRNTISLTFTLQLKDFSKYDEVYAWLNGADKQGKLIVSNDLGKYYKATCTTIKASEMSLRFSSISITFTCLPFRYSTDTTTVYLTSSKTITVGGNYYCEPRIQINGSGNGVLTVNGSNLSVYVDGYIIVDSERLLAYKGSTVLLNQTSGDLPRLQVGENSVSFSGGITSVEILKNERWL